MSDLPGAALLVLAIIGWRRPHVSLHSVLVTLAFVAAQLPDGALAIGTGGVLAACLRLQDGTRWRAPLHLAMAGACAALAYALGARPGGLAVLMAVAMLMLIGAHLALAFGGAGGVPVSSLLSALAAAGLAAALTIDGTHCVLAVACAMLGISCARGVSFAGIAREAP
ncbi:hypothetical protein QCE63_31795 [Caballeronia sp. LZ065]|uniref:hypothetical protein n=1 Tax=Caballeronia sp. LZ065 TaxID=3038571 RepID=UPI00285EB1C7|nr:hypothetical protein [Caballeronia sp. LZ065]MDR5784005.1 hypothetical protein [Caballeronia sp. LZ065]